MPPNFHARACLALLYVAVTSALKCLVTRPGYGLVTEQCPDSAVGCRIKIDHHAVQFYEYSALYDRNQLVCVYRNEYGPMKSAGCVQRRAGKVRCWCVDGDACNTPERSRQLYQDFRAGKIQVTDFNPAPQMPRKHEARSSYKKVTPTTTSTTTTTTATTTTSTTSTTEKSRTTPTKLHNEYEELEYKVVANEQKPHRLGQHDQFESGGDNEDEQPSTETPHHRQTKHHNKAHKTRLSLDPMTKITEGHNAKDQDSNRVFVSSASEDQSPEMDFRGELNSAERKILGKIKSMTAKTTVEPLKSIVFPSVSRDQVKVIRVNGMAYNNMLDSPEFKEALKKDWNPIEEESNEEPEVVEENLALLPTEELDHIRPRAGLQIRDLNDIMGDELDLNPSPAWLASTLLILASLVLHCF